MRPRKAVGTVLLGAHAAHAESLVLHRLILKRAKFFGLLHRLYRLLSLKLFVKKAYFETFWVHDGLPIKLA